MWCFLDGLLLDGLQVFIYSRLGILQLGLKCCDLIWIFSLFLLHLERAIPPLKIIEIAIAIAPNFTPRLPCFSAFSICSLWSAWVCSNCESYSVLGPQLWLSFFWFNTFVFGRYWLSILVLFRFNMLIIFACHAYFLFLARAEQPVIFGSQLWVFVTLRSRAVVLVVLYACLEQTNVSLKAKQNTHRGNGAQILQLFLTCDDYFGRFCLSMFDRYCDRLLNIFSTVGLTMKTLCT